MTSIDDVLARAPRVQALPIVRSPTPLEHHRGLSRALGVELYLKREDTIDELGSGHKVRKLGYVVADALARGADLLVTAGSLASNQCKAVAAAAAHHGLRAHLVFGGDRQVRPETPPPDYLLATLFAPTITWCDRASWARIMETVDAVVERERADGATPYVIPPGASSWPGLLGSVELGLELLEQADQLGLAPGHVVAPAGSAGTCCGVDLACAWRDRRWTITGICFGEQASAVQAYDRALREQAPFGRDLPVGVVYHDGAQGDGYHQPRRDELDLLRETLVEHGLLFDPNYMLKTYKGLRQLVASGAIAQGATVVLVHTGGRFGLFGYADRVST